MICMKKEFHEGNRKHLYEGMKEASLLVLFAGAELRKTNDEYYPFYTDRNFLYLTGLDTKEAIFLVQKEAGGAIREQVYILPKDPMKERWVGKRVEPEQATACSGIDEVRFLECFQDDFHRLVSTGWFAHIYLDTYKVEALDEDRAAHRFARTIQDTYPFITIETVSPLVRRLRTIKQPCEIEAMKEAERITCAGITAMMKASVPGMYEYQYKAEFDHALLQFGPQGPAFPPIISAGRNNFCIHYYDYKGQAQDGDLILNDVGAWYDNLMNDVSRGWPCNGIYSEKQRLLYECALHTSDYMFSIIRPGMEMADVDKTIRSYNAQLLCEAGVLKHVDEVGRLMWHGGAHHVGYDVHDVVETPKFIAPGMVFCVDIGIYHEEWGIGFRLEDNCLVTQEGCVNLSAITPRTIEEIQDNMKKGYF